MPTPTRTHHDPEPGACEARPGPPAARESARRGGLVAGAAILASCGVTTALLASGLVAAGGGLVGSLELTVAAIAIPVTLLARRALPHLRRRTTQPPRTKEQQ